MLKDRVMKIKITPEVLNAAMRVHVLGMAIPPGSKILETTYDKKNNLWEVLIQNHQFPEVKKGQDIPYFVNEPFNSIRWHENMAIERQEREKKEREKEEKNK